LLPSVSTLIIATSGFFSLAVPASQHSGALLLRTPPSKPGFFNRLPAQAPLKQNPLPNSSNPKTKINSLLKLEKLMLYSPPYC
jgi:hypothetical protein